MLSALNLEHLRLLVGRLDGQTINLLNRKITRIAYGSGLKK